MSTLQWLSHYSVVVMMALFSMIFITTYLPGRKKEIERDGQIPFKDDV